jgi:hypothetical protein
VPEQLVSARQTTVEDRTTLTKAANKISKLRIAGPCPGRNGVTNKSNGKGNNYFLPAQSLYF